MRTWLQAVAQEQDDAIRDYFSATPLYLEAMLTTRIVPRRVTLETEDFTSLDERILRRSIYIVEEQPYPGPVEEVLRVTD